MSRRRPTDEDRAELEQRRLLIARSPTGKVVRDGRVYTVRRLPSTWPPRHAEPVTLRGLVPPP